MRVVTSVKVFNFYFLFYLWEISWEVSFVIAFLLGHLAGNGLDIYAGKISQAELEAKEAKEIFGDTFVELFCSIKDLEVNAYNKIITAWEREYLLLNV